MIRAEAKINLAITTKGEEKKFAKAASLKIFENSGEKANIYPIECNKW